MTNDDLNYTGGERKKSKKSLIILLLLLLAFLLTVGTVIAYFSDQANKNGNITTGNLRITGSYTTLYNGTETALESIGDIIPGDTVVIKGTITNTGKESAWVREQISIGGSGAMLDYLSVYNAELTSEQIFAGTGISQYALDLDIEGNAVSGARVLNAAGGTTPAAGEYEYIGADSYDFAITIYFAHTAPNATQNLNFDFNVLTQALQFENNNATLPDSDAWATVEAAG